MVDYDGFCSIIQGSKQYEFEGTTLTLRGFYDSNEAVLDFENMDEHMFEELIEESTDNIDYNKAQNILAGSKEYQFEGTVLSVRDYYTGDKISLNLGLIDEDMYEELKGEELEDYYEDFEDAINALGEEIGQSL